MMSEDEDEAGSDYDQSCGYRNAHVRGHFHPQAHSLAQQPLHGPAQPQTLAPAPAPAPAPVPGRGPGPGFPLQTRLRLRLWLRFGAREGRGALAWTV